MAENVGRYAWALYGFDFAEGQVPANVFAAAQHFASKVGHPLELDPEIRSWELARHAGEVPSEDFFVAQGLPVPDDQNGKKLGLGQAMLLGPPLQANAWHGRLGLKTKSEGRVRFEDYCRT